MRCHFRPEFPPARAGTFNRAQHRLRGRALVGERLVCHVPHGHWKTTTFLAALRVSGLTAPLVVDGAIHGALFKGWIVQHLVPTLRAGDIVVMDNQSSHKRAGIREAIEAGGAAVADLPPYSPDLNPIETVLRGHCGLPAATFPGISSCLESPSGNSKNTIRLPMTLH